MTCRTRAVVMIALATALWARSGGALSKGRGDEFRTRLDSLNRLPPNMRYYEMLKEPAFRDMVKPQIESSGCRLVGKWGRGPSWRVTGKDDLVFLSLGSECAIVNFADSAHPQVLNEIQARGLVANSVINDSILLTGGRGIDLWNVENPVSPVFLSRIEVTVSDIAIRDSLLCSVCSDSFRVFNVADPRNPVQIGASLDTGFSLSVSGNYAYVLASWNMPIVDISNPRNPHRVGAYGARTTSVFARDTLAYVSTLSAGFQVLNLRDPQNVFVLGTIPSLSNKNDVYVTSYFAYVPDFTVIDISIPSSPAIVGQCATAGFQRGVWVKDPWSRAYVADHFNGLVALSIADPIHPVLDTIFLRADEADDISVLGDGRAYVADYSVGFKILDVSNAASPMELGAYDTVGDHIAYYSWAVAARDSLAFTGFNELRCVDVSRPGEPRLLGIAPIMNPARAMVIRDTLLYVAEDYWFQIYSVANPRSPRLLGSCQLPNGATSVFLADTQAYVTQWIVNIKNPTSPFIIDSFSDGPMGICVKDTFAYLALNYGGLQVWNVANSTSPRLLDTVYFERGYDALVVDSLLYFGGLDLRVLSLDDPSHPRQVGYYTTPYRVRRLFYSPPYVYAACFGAGVCIFETTPSSGIVEAPAPVTGSDTNRFQMTVVPNPIRDEIELRFGHAEARTVMIKIADVAGRKVIEVRLPVAEGKAHLVLPGGKMPAGVYFVTAKSSAVETTVKVVKQ